MANQNRFFEVWIILHVAGCVITYVWGLVSVPEVRVLGFGQLSSAKDSYQRAAEKPCLWGVCRKRTLCSLDDLAVLSLGERRQP